MDGPALVRSRLPAQPRLLARPRGARTATPSAARSRWNGSVIAGILVAAAVAAGVFFVGKIKRYGSKIP